MGYKVGGIGREKVAVGRETDSPALRRSLKGLRLEVFPQPVGAAGRCLALSSPFVCFWDLKCLSL